MSNFKPVCLLSLVAALAGGPGWSQPKAPHPARPHNVIIFVADGLRSQIVTPQTAPALAALRAEGVDFRNSHSLFPTVTTANASAIATGHYIGDTGNFANDLYVGTEPLAAPIGARFAPIENDSSLALLNARYGGNYLNEDSLLATARQAGFQTAAIGKYGPALIQDVTERSGLGTLVIDDNTGKDAKAGSPPIAGDVSAAIQAAGLAPVAPALLAAAAPGQPGRSIARDQVQWMAAVTAKVVLPRFQRAGRPFVMVFWSRDPDITQHGQLDAPQALVPGINGPSSMDAIGNASEALQTLRDAVKTLGLEGDTDIVVTADHGFSTVDNASATSAAARIAYPDTPKGTLPPVFLAIDLSLGLDLPLWSRAGKRLDPARGERPDTAAFLGVDPAHPDIVVDSSGGAALVYLPGADPKGMAARVAALLTGEDYVGALFVNDDLGPVPGALPMSAVNLMGTSRTLRPGLVVSFASSATGCPRLDACQTLISEGRPKGQGMHGSLGRGDTHNFMAAVGPDFRKGFVDPSPVSNADLAWTVARITGLTLHPKGRLVGRPMTEALIGGAPAPGVSGVLRSAPAADGFVTVLDYQQVGQTRYFDAAGMPGRVYGLKP